MAGDARSCEMGFPLRTIAYKSSLTFNFNTIYNTHNAHPKPEDPFFLLCFFSISLMFCVVWGGGLSWLPISFFVHFVTQRIVPRETATCDQRWALLPPVERHHVDAGADSIRMKVNHYSVVQQHRNLSSSRLGDPVCQSKDLQYANDDHDDDDDAPSTTRLRKTERTNSDQRCTSSFCRLEHSTKIFCQKIGYQHQLNCPWY